MRLVYYAICSGSSCWSGYTTGEERLEFRRRPMQQWVELVNTQVGFEAIVQQFSDLQLLLPCWRMSRGSIVCRPSFPFYWNCEQIKFLFNKKQKSTSIFFYASEKYLKFELYWKAEKHFNFLLCKWEVVKFLFVYFL